MLSILNCSVSDILEYIPPNIALETEVSYLFSNAIFLFFVSINNRYAINNSCRILLLLISWQSLYYPDFLKSYSSPSITSPQSCTPSLNQYVRLASKSFTVIGFINYFFLYTLPHHEMVSVFTFGNFQACSCKAFIYAVSDGFQFSPKSLLEKTLCSFTHSIIHFFALSIIQ